MNIVLHIQISISIFRSIYIVSVSALSMWPVLRPHILYPHCIAFHSSSAVKASLLKEGPIKNKIFKIMRILSSNISSIALVKMITLEPCSIQAQCETLDRCGLSPPLQLDRRGPLDRWRLFRVPALGHGRAGIPSWASDCRTSRFPPASQALVMP